MNFVIEGPPGGWGGRPAPRRADACLARSAKACCGEISQGEEWPVGYSHPCMCVGALGESSGASPTVPHVGRQGGRPSGEGCGVRREVSQMELRRQDPTTPSQRLGSGEGAGDHSASARTENSLARGGEAFSAFWVFVRRPLRAQHSSTTCNQPKVRGGKVRRVSHCDS